MKIYRWFLVIGALWMVVTIFIISLIASTYQEYIILFSGLPLFYIGLIIFGIGVSWWFIRLRHRALNE